MSKKWKYLRSFKKTVGKKIVKSTSGTLHLDWTDPTHVECLFFVDDSVIVFAFQGSVLGGQCTILGDVKDENLKKELKLI